MIALDRTRLMVRSGISTFFLSRCCQKREQSLLRKTRAIPAAQIALKTGRDDRLSPPTDPMFTACRESTHK